MSEARKPFALWKIGDDEYKLKLRTSDVVELEEKYKTNLTNIMGDSGSGMPALSVMLDVAHAALQKFHHGIKKREVEELFDRYMEEEDGSQLDFYMTVYMEVFAVSGFFPKKVRDEMMESLAKEKENL